MVVRLMEEQQRRQLPPPPVSCSPLLGARRRRCPPLLPPPGCPLCPTHPQQGTGRAPLPPLPPRRPFPRATLPQAAAAVAGPQPLVGTQVAAAAALAWCPPTHPRAMTGPAARLWRRRRPLGPHPQRGLGSGMGAGPTFGDEVGWGALQLLLAWKMATPPSFPLALVCDCVGVRSWLGRASASHAPKHRGSVSTRG